MSDNSGIIGTQRDFAQELARGVDLSETVGSDLTVLSNITATVNAIAAQTAYWSSRTENTVDSLSAIEKGLFLVAKLPIGGGVATGLRAVTKETFARSNRSKTRSWPSEARRRLSARGSMA